MEELILELNESETTDTFYRYLVKVKDDESNRIGGSVKIAVTSINDKITEAEIKEVLNFGSRFSKKEIEVLASKERNRLLEEGWL